jgi:hypothetical protein
MRMTSARTVTEPKGDVIDDGIDMEDNASEGRFARFRFADMSEVVVVFVLVVVLVVLVVVVVAVLAVRC